MSAAGIIGGLVRAPWLPVMLTGGVAGGILLSSFLAVTLWLHPYPVMDTVTVIDGYFSLPWAQFLFFRGDNEHLPWLAMPLFAVDIALFGARGVFLIVVLLLLNTAIALMLAILVGRRRHRLMAAIVILAGFFWLLHAENLIWPKQIHMYLSLALFMLACLRLVWGAERPGPDGAPTTGSVLALILLLTGSTFSFAYGIVGWLALLLAALSLRWPGRALALLAAGFAVNLAIYVLAYAPHTLPATHTRPADSLLQPLSLVWYIMHYIGHPLRRLLFGGRELALVLSAAGILAGFWFMLRAVRRRPSPAEAGLLAVLLFSMGAAGITALSRVGFGPIQAETLRYGVVQILFWAALAGLTLPFLARVRGRAWLCLLLVLLMLPFQWRMFNRLARDDADTWLAVTALATGAETEKRIRERLHPDIAQLHRVTESLRNRGLSVFADAPVSWLGRPVRELAEQADGASCTGWVRAMAESDETASQSHLALEGSALETPTGRPVEWVIVTGGGGRVIGLGHQGSWRDAAEVTWRGYTQRGGSSPLAYAILPDSGRLCPLSWQSPTER